MLCHSKMDWESIKRVCEEQPEDIKSVIFSKEDAVNTELAIFKKVAARRRQEERAKNPTLVCICGKQYKKHNRSIHLKGKYHQAFEAGGSDPQRRI